MADGYRALADAIIIQAVEDYRKSDSRGVRAAIVRFFRSDWFKILSDADGEMIIDRLKKECK